MHGWGCPVKLLVSQHLHQIFALLSLKKWKVLEILGGMKESSSKRQRTALVVWTRAGFYPHWSETFARGYTKTEDFPQAHPLWLFWATTDDSCDLTPQFHAGLH